MIDRSARVRLYITNDLSLGLDIALSYDQAKYLFKVMRLNVGQLITILDGKTGEYEAEISGKGSQTGKIRVVRKISELQKPSDLWLLFSPLRKKRTEWVVEKATELGVRKIIPVITSRTIDVNIRVTRLKSIMIEALEQCGGTFLPDLTEPMALADCLEFWPSERSLVFCDETLAQKSMKSILSKDKLNKVAAILIGPEGGFSISEGKLIRQNKRVISISLGSRILRADTAAVSAISIWKNLNLIS